MADSSRRAHPALGFLALAFYAIHAAYHLVHRQPENLFWACHLASVFVGIGFLTGSATANGIGFLWLAMGDAMWILDLATGGEFLPTSLFTHVGGLVLSLYGLASYGMPRHAWWQAVLAFLVLQQICRWSTPAAANVNLAFAVWSGWERLFPSYLSYMAMLAALALAVFIALGALARRLTSSSPADARSGAR